MNANVQISTWYRSRETKQEITPLYSRLFSDYWTFGLNQLFNVAALGVGLPTVGVWTFTDLHWNILVQAESGTPDLSIRSPMRYRLNYSAP